MCRTCESGTGQVWREHFRPRRPVDTGRSRSFGGRERLWWWGTSRNQPSPKPSNTLNLYIPSKITWITWINIKHFAVENVFHSTFKVTLRKQGRLNARCARPEQQHVNKYKRIVRGTVAKMLGIFDTFLFNMLAFFSTQKTNGESKTQFLWSPVAANIHLFYFEEVLYMFFTNDIYGYNYLWISFVDCFCMSSYKPENIFQVYFLLRPVWKVPPVESRGVIARMFVLSLPWTPKKKSSYKHTCFKTWQKNMKKKQKISPLNVFFL